ncbi:MAG: M6 family metalloprotease domain-containing protein [Mucinivorans sp.]
MPRLLTTVVVLWLSFSLALAAPAINRPIEITQSDGSRLTIVVSGDEYYRLTTTIDGYQLMQRDGIYYYYDAASTKSTGELLRASDPADRSSAERMALFGRMRGRVDGLSPLDANRGDYSTSAQRMEALMNPNRPSSKATEPQLPKEALVLLVEFADLKFRSSAAHDQFDQLLNTNPKSAQAYFADNSMGKYKPTFFVPPVITLSKGYAYYGRNERQNGQDQDGKVNEMVVEACRAARANGSVNFSRFNTDGDANYVDIVYLIFAGDNEAEGGGADKIWPHSSQLVGANSIVLDGVRLSKYACTSELHGTGRSAVMMGIGTFCHEYCHVLGLPDFYDTDNQTGGYSKGLYNISIMSSGNYNDDGHTPPHLNALERYMLGWSTFLTLLPDQQISLAPVQTGNQAYFIPSLADVREFYCIESRTNTAWDNANSMPNFDGLLIYHVDMSNNDSGNGVLSSERWRTNTINANKTHMCMRLIESSGGELDGFSATPQLILYPGLRHTTEFTGRSYGGIDCRGNPVQIELQNITWSPTKSTFATRASQGTGKLMSIVPSQRSMKIVIDTEHATPQKYVITYRHTASTITLRAEIPPADNSIVVRNLSPNSKYEVILASVVEGSEIALLKANVQTLPLTAPFPAIKGLKANYTVGEMLVGEVTNLASPARSVIFDVDGQPIPTTGYKLARNGLFTLSCTIIYEDSGEREVISRQIKVN